MSSQRIPLDNLSAIDAISDDSIPLGTTSVWSRTGDRYAAMTQEERRDFKLAVACTVGGVALTAAAFGIEIARPKSKLPTALRAVGYSLDYADGYFAKRTATEESAGAVTELGAIMDPLADKTNNLLNELALVTKSKLDISDFAIRLARDFEVTAVRRYATKHSSGKVDVKANKFGKLNTVVRDGANLFASTKIAEKHASANRVIQMAANVYSVASGAYTSKKIVDEYKLVA